MCVHTCSYLCKRPKCIERQRDTLREQVESLTSREERARELMRRAAREIQDHWECHSDADGYGPINLIDSLERF